MIQVFTEKADILSFISERRKSLKVGFVPTMGALHEGHFSLFERCRAENDVAVASIFVNPLQFNNPEDLKKYPHTPDADLAMLERAGFDAVFMPSAEAFYEGESLPDPKLGYLADVMEGRFRPGHFEGVYKVVWLLFHYVQPHKAYFGAKDFQQLAVIRYMVSEEKLPVEIVPCPTQRESSGLAMSSRNRRLEDADRQKAGRVSSFLLNIRNRGHIISSELKNEFQQLISELNFDPEYLELADADTLKLLDEKGESPAVVCIAYYAGGVRLIDNVILN